MSEPRFSRLATDALARARRDLDAPAPSPDAEAATIDAIGQAIVQRARARRRRGIAIGVAVVTIAAAAVLVLVVGVEHRDERSASHVAPPSSSATNLIAISGSAHALHGAPIVVRGGQTVGVDRGRPLEAGDHVVADDGARASVVLSTGSRIAVETGTDLGVTLLSSEQRFKLVRGTVAADVAKLHAGERFLVQTSDAEVEVRGTSFHVSVAEPCAGSATRVSVSEGVVVVRTSTEEIRVGAGSQWPVSCGAVAAASGAKEVRPSPSAPHVPATVGHPLGHLEPSPSAPRSVLTPSELSAQNRAYAAAVETRHRGASREAAAQFAAFAASYPSSPLTESAYVERMRLLSHDAEGPRAARDYLARYPSGFARDEAAAIAGGTP